MKTWYDDTESTVNEVPERANRTCSNRRVSTADGHQRTPWPIIAHSCDLIVKCPHERDSPSHN